MDDWKWREFMPALAFFEGEIVPLEEAKISVVTHAFNYGTGVFEGIRGNWNEDKDELYLFRVKEHYERLYRSCKMINIDLRYSLDQLEEMTLDLVKSCGYKQDIYVRPLAYKSGDLVGLRVHDIPDDFLIYVVPFGNYLESDKGITCSFSSFLRVEDSMIPPSAKVTGMYVNNSLAKSEAVWRGFDEAIMLTRDGFISEGSGENIFLVKDGVVYTPQITDHILEGLTRNTLIELCKNELGIEVVERRIPKSDVVVADEFFMTGTAAHVTPVLSVDGRDIGDGSIGPITSKLQKLYFDIVRGKNGKYSDWLSPVFS